MSHRKRSKKTPASPGPRFAEQSNDEISACLFRWAREVRSGSMSAPQLFAELSAAADSLSRGLGMTAIVDAATGETLVHPKAKVVPEDISYA